MAGRKKTTKKSSPKKKRAPSKRASPRRPRKPAARKSKKVVRKKTTAKKPTAKKTKKQSSPRKKTTKARPARIATAAKARLEAPPPSQRAIAVSAQRPFERSLTDEERDAMAKVCHTAKEFLRVEGEPLAIVRGIAAYLDQVRSGTKEAPTSQDVRLGLGVLWGEQVRAQVGWTWVHLSYPDGFASYALVPDDRAFACFPLNRIPELLAEPTRTNTSVSLFESIRTGTLPMRRANAYLVIG